MRYRVVLAAIAITSGAVGAWNWGVLRNATGRVNSSSGDVAPFIDSQNNLYFASNRSGGSGGYDLYTSAWSGTRWNNAQSLGAPVNTSAHETGPTMNNSRNRLWFASNRAGGYGGYDLWQSNYSGGSWGAATNLGSTVNSSEADTHPHYYWDGTWNLYFASRRSGGYGGYDIYYTRFSYGRWSTPQNLGYRVNTSANETAPSLTPDGNYLYFQSNRGGGSGGNDIWVSEYVGGNWQPPVNLGSPINSNLGEADPSLSPDGMRLVLDILNKSGGRGSYDIWYSDDENVNVTPTSLGKIKSLYR